MTLEPLNLQFRGGFYGAQKRGFLRNAWSRTGCRGNNSVLRENAYCFNGRLTVQCQLPDIPASIRIGMV